MFFYVTADYEATEILRTLGGRRKREEEKEKVENTEPAPKDKGKGAPSASSKTVSKKPGLADLSAALSLDAQAPSNASPIHSPQPPQQLPGPPSSSGSGFVNYFWRSSSSTSEHKE